MSGSRRYFENELHWDNGPADYQVRVTHDVLDLLPDDVESVLDVGCGDGCVTNQLPASVEVMGVDTSVTALKHVQCRTTVASITDLPFEDEAFDFVMTNDVLEHLTEGELLDAIGELKRVSRKYILVTLPFAEQLEANLTQCRACAHRYHVNHHHRSCDVPMAISLLEPEYTAVNVRFSGSLSRQPYDPTVELRHRHGIYRRWERSMCPECHQRGGVDDDGPLIRMLDSYRGQRWQTDLTIPSGANRSEIMTLYTRLDAIESDGKLKVTWERRASIPKTECEDRDPSTLDFSNPLHAVPEFVPGGVISTYVSPPHATIREEGLEVLTEGETASLMVRIPALLEPGDQVEIDFSSISEGRIHLYCPAGPLTYERLLNYADIGEGRHVVQVPITEEIYPDRFGTPLLLTISGAVVLHELRLAEPAAVQPFIRLRRGMNTLTEVVDGTTFSWSLHSTTTGWYPRPDLAAMAVTPLSEGPVASSEDFGPTIEKWSSALMAEYARAISGDRPTQLTPSDPDARINRIFSELRSVQSRLGERVDSTSSALSKLNSISERLVTATSTLTTVVDRVDERTASVTVRRSLPGRAVSAVGRTTRFGYNVVLESLWLIRESFYRRKATFKLPSPWQHLPGPPPCDDRPKLLVLSHMFPQPTNVFSGTFVLEQVRALRESGIDARVVCSTPYWMQTRNPLRKMCARRMFEDQHAAAEWVEYDDVPVLYLPYDASGTFGQHGASHRRSVLRHIDTIHAGFPFTRIHAHTGYLDGSSARRVAKKFNVPYVVTEHTGPFSILLKHPTVRRETLAALNDANAVVAVSSHQAKEIGEHLDPRKAEGILVIPNGVDFAQFGVGDPSPTPTSSSAPGRLLFVGHVVPVKDLLTLLQALAELRRGGVNVSLRIVGGTPDAGYAQEVTSAISQLELTDSVELMGPRSRSEVAELMSNECDMLVLPSRSETFGCVLIEALACGKPVVASDCGGPADIVTDPSLGEMFPVGDVHGLARAIATVLDNRRNYRPDEIRRFARERFAYDVVARRYAELIFDTETAPSVLPLRGAA